MLFSSDSRSLLPPKQQCALLRRRSQLLAVAAAVSLVVVQHQALAQSQDKLAVAPAGQVLPWSAAAPADRDTQLAQASTSTGSTLVPLTVLGTQSGRKKNKAIITDTLWGNLILEIAFDRDPVLNKFGVYVKLMNIGTMTGLSSVALGTVYQTIYATAGINPPPPHQDTTAPGIAGIAFSSVALLTYISRTIIGHELAVHIRNREILLRDNIEALLARLEDSNCEDTAAAGQLKDLIGERASGEWVQIWRATHKLSTEAHRVGMQMPTSPKLVATAKHPDGGM